MYLYFPSICIVLICIFVVGYIYHLSFEYNKRYQLILI